MVNLEVLQDGMGFKLKTWLKILTHLSSLSPELG